MIGLKYLKEKLKGGSITYKLRELRYELKYAWQRVWVGYDDTFVFDMDNTFIKLYKKLFKELLENGISYPYEMTFGEWKDVQEKFIDLLEKIDVDSFDIFENKDEIIKTKNEFFKLFSKHFYDLWD